MVKIPDSMDDVIYFTRRNIGDGKAMAWVYKQKCQKCTKAIIGKPKDKTGKVMIRAKEYVCPACNFRVEKKEYEESLLAEVQYTCPHCKFQGEDAVPFKRKKVDGIDTLRAKCKKCQGNIDITKKMKEKGSSDDDDE